MNGRYYLYVNEIENLEINIQSPKSLEKKEIKTQTIITVNEHINLKMSDTYISVFALDDRCVAFSDFRDSVAKTVCVALVTLANGNFLHS